MRVLVFLLRPRAVMAMLASFAATANAADFPALIGRELEAIRAERRAPLVWKIADAPLPVSRRDASVELREAWSYFRSVSRPVKRPAKPDEKRTVSFQKNQPRFNAVLDRIARGENRSALDELALFGWASWCGTGYERMREPVTWARWLVLLRERRLADAAVESLEVSPQGMGGLDRDEQLPELQHRLFEICGIDWEKLLAGMSMYSSNGVREIEGMPAALYRGGGWMPAGILAAHGSERGARYLLQLSALILPGERSDYVNAMMVLLKPAGYNRERGVFAGSNSRPAERISPDPLPIALQHEVARTLIGWLDDLDYTPTILEIIGLLAEVRGPVEREALRGMLTHSSTEVANTAAEALRKMGEETGPLREREPVRFRILVNGKPLAGEYVGQNLAMSDGSNLFGSEKTDQNGMGTIERDHFSDPKRKISRLTFSARPSTSAFWFVMDVPVPEKFDLETPVNVRTEPVTFVLTLNRPVDFYRDKKATISITRLDARGESVMDHFGRSAEWTMPVASEIVLPGVQAGDYDVEIQVPGSAAWKSGRRKLGAAPARIDVTFNN